MRAGSEEATTGRGVPVLAKPLEQREEETSSLPYEDCKFKITRVWQRFFL